MRILLCPLAATAAATECSPLMRESSDQPDQAPSNPPPSARGVTAEQPTRTSSPGNAAALSDPAVVGRWTTGDVTRAAVGVLAVWYGLQLFWAVNAFVFLIFLATLFGLAVARGVDYLERFKIRRGVGSALIVVGALAVIGGGLAWTAPTLVEQGKELQTEFPAAIQKLQTWIDSKRGGLWGSLLSAAAAPSAASPGRDAPTAGASPSVASPTVASPTVASPAPSNTTTGATAATTQSTTSATRSVPSSSSAPVTSAPATSSPTATTRPAAEGSQSKIAPQSEVLKQRLTDALSGLSKYALSVVSNTIEVLGAFILIVFLAIYIGAEPDVYRGWLLSTVPAGSRAQVRVVLREISTVLRKWLVTQLVAMLVIGATTTVVLLLLGVKAPFALGFIAGLLEFIPTVGPILSAVPGVIMGFVDSPEKALTVAIAYYGIQFIENNLLIPFLMRGEMDLPPAITVIAQTLMTLVFGFVGLMVAVPLTAAVLVPLRMIAERENERERALYRSKRGEDSGSDLLSDVEDPDAVIDEADRGPAAPPRNKKSQYSRLPSSTETLKIPDRP